MTKKEAQDIINSLTRIIEEKIYQHFEMHPRMNGVEFEDRFMGTYGADTFIDHKLFRLYLRHIVPITTTKEPNVGDIIVWTNEGTEWMPFDKTFLDSVYTKEQIDEIMNFILTKMYRFFGAPIKDTAVINYIGSDDGNTGLFLLGTGFFDKFANLSEDWGKGSAIEIFRDEGKEIINVYAPSGHSLVYGRKETLEDRNVYYDLIGANTTDESIIVCLTIEDKEGNELLLKRGINANTKIIEGIEEFIQGGMADPSLLEEKTICTKEYVDEQIGAIDEVLNYIIGAE